MTKLGVAFWVGLVLTTGFTTFNVKYAVQGIEDELSRVRRETIAEDQERRVLAAEWTYLNQPERLAELNRVYLQLAPLKPNQLQRRIDEIALRAPAPGTDILLAANPPGGAQPVSAPAPGRAVPAHGALAALGSTGNLIPAVARVVEAPAAASTDGNDRADAAAALAEALSVLNRSAVEPAPKLRLAKATPRSLDALIARVADVR